MSEPDSVTNQLILEDKITFSFDGKVLYECKFTEYVDAIRELVEKRRNPHRRG